MAVAAWTRPRVNCFSPRTPTSIETAPEKRGVSLRKQDEEKQDEAKQDEAKHQAFLAVTSRGAERRENGGGVRWEANLQHAERKIPEGGRR